MLLKRIHDHSSKGDPTVVSVKVLRAGPRQNFSPGFIEGGVAEGWLALGGGKITITSDKGPVVYTIARAPGLYCCHCETKLDDSASAQKHVASAHKGASSPDPTNPAGYRQDNFYAAVKQGEGIDTLTKEQAAEMDKKVRAAFLAKIGKKYGVKKAS